MVKRYYWLKLKRDFFKRQDIQVIESMPNGKDYVLFYLKLLCESVDNEGNLRFNEEIPYNEQMLSVITNTDVDVVRSAIKIFIELKMMEIMDDGTYFLNEVQKMVGSAANNSNAMRQQRFRDNQKQRALEVGVTKNNDTVTLPVTNNNESKSKELEIEKELEIDRDINISSSSENSNEEFEYKNSQNEIELISQKWNKVSESTGIKSIYTIKPGTTRYKMLKKRIHDYGKDSVIGAIESIKNSSFLQGNNNRGWEITFDWFVKPNNFIKVLEGNYMDKNIEKKKQEENKSLIDEVNKEIARREKENAI